ncbi:MAG: hypothetical protein JSW28_02045 [Thermoplasmata archaeon]|nr:MAG: hypothetical protein JSW28_02045 [Thermoplasmata archaeon]
MTETIYLKMLKEAAKRGLIGASRDDLFRVLKGIRYSELEDLIAELERKGYITVEWVGFADFVITVTPDGLEYLN